MIVDAEPMPSNGACLAAASAPDLTPAIAPEAFHGIAGRVVSAIDPITEADPVATLVTFLVSVGNMLGADVHAMAGEDPHPPRLYAALVGQSSKGRKGMSWRAVRRILSGVDPAWSGSRIMSGLSSGEGVIYHVRDAREEQQPLKQHGRTIGYETVVADPGVDDKRLCIEEPELAAVLRRMDRESNSLSAILRQAWDDGTLRTLTKNTPLRATRAHISVVAHITGPELVRNLGATERVNGFGNRFLFFHVRRSKELPDPGRLPDDVLAQLVADLRDVATWAHALGVHTIRRDTAAAEAWDAIYSRLSAERPGLLGSLTARAEAHVLRLSVLYAMLDRSAVIRPEHLAAAVAVWAHAEASARHIFGEGTGDPIADQIAQRLTVAAEMTRTQIRDIFSRNLSEDRLEAALRVLQAAGVATVEKRQTRGRPAETWRLTR